jgi:hypothetical protein
MLALFVMSMICETAEARGRWRNRNRSRGRITYRSNNNRTVVRVALWNHGMSDQAKCQAEANYMAANGIYAHVGGQIGFFEGWGSSFNGTCQPGRGMTCTGSACATRPNGTQVWVRSWR